MMIVICDELLKSLKANMLPNIHQILYMLPNNYFFMYYLKEAAMGSLSDILYLYFVFQLNFNIVKIVEAKKKHLLAINFN